MRVLLQRAITSTPIMRRRILAPLTSLGLGAVGRARTQPALSVAMAEKAVELDRTMPAAAGPWHLLAYERRWPEFGRAVRDRARD